MQLGLAAILLALVFVLTVRALVSFVRTQRRARALMREYREGTDEERAAMERRAEAQRELRKRM